MTTPRPHAFVRAGTVAKFLRGLMTQFRGAGWNRSNLREAVWLQRGPAYWFAGQVRSTSGGAEVLPLWVTSENAEIEAVSGFVSCPWPGVISLRVVHSVAWSVVPVGGGSVLSNTSTLESVSLVGGANPPPEQDSTVRIYQAGGGPVIVSQTATSVAVRVLASLDDRGRVAHVNYVSGSGVLAVNHGRGAVSVLPRKRIIEEDPPP